jgi:hypothetical protein
VYKTFVVAAGSGEAVRNISADVCCTGSVRLPLVKAPRESVTFTVKDTLDGVATGGVPVKAPPVDRFNQAGRVVEVHE